MEFLLSYGFDAVTRLADLENRRLSLLEGPFSRRVVGRVELLATPEPAIASNGELALFGGYCALGGEFLHPLLPAPDATKVSAVESLLGGGSADGGVYFVGTLGSEGRGRVEIDPLGQYPLFYLRRGRSWAVSNNVHFLAVAAESTGWSLTRSMTPALDNLIYGGPMGGRTQFEEVNALCAGQGLTFSDHELEMLEAASEFPSDASRPAASELVDSVLSALHLHLGAVGEATAGAVAVADITGGADSRAVLSVIASGGHFPGVGGRCITRFPHPDANVAGLLMETLGIEPALFPHRAPGVEGRTEAQKLTIRQAAHLHGGIRDAAVHSSFAMPDLVHLTGSFGELGGRTPGVDYVAACDRIDRDGAGKAVDLLIERRTRAGALTLVTRGALAEFRPRMTDEILALADKGIPRDHIIAELYLRTRCRTHFGLGNFYANLTRIRPDPLATPSLVRLRRRLSFKERDANFSMLSIILKAMPSIAFLPMVKPWGASAVPAEHLDEWRGMVSVNQRTDCLSQYRGALTQNIGIGGNTRTSAVPIGGGAGSKRFAAAHAISGNQSMLAEILDSIPTTDAVWDIFDRERAVSAAVREPESFSTGIQVNDLSRAAMALCWITGMETPLQLCEKRSMTETVRENFAAG